VAVGFRADEGGGQDAKVELEDRRERFSLLAELPDLWDINITDWSLEQGIDGLTGAALEGFDGEGVDLACVYTGRISRLAALSLVLVTARTRMTSPTGRSASVLTRSPPPGSSP
jgi:hypothetical protein